MFDADGETAIEGALRAVHPDAEPVRFGIPEPGKRELAGCIAIRVEEPVPHWLVVSRGFTELGEKTEEDPEVSGWGFELTCRLPARSDEHDFGWVLNWMQNIADYLEDKVSFLEPYHHMPMWKATQEDEIAAVVFVDDIELGPARSQNGSFNFLQMVGLTSGEHQALEAWDGRALVELMRQRDPLLLMDVQRRSYLRESEFVRAVEEGRERDGSSTGVSYGVSLLWFVEPREIQLHLDERAARLFRESVRARLSHGKPMLFFGDPRKSVRPDGSLAIHSQVNVVLRPEDGASEIAEEEGRKLAVIRLNADAVAQLADVLEDKPGSYVLPALPRVRFVVVTAERFRQPRYPW